MIYKVEFNGGKHQRLHYYWIPYKSIWCGEYRTAFAKEKACGNVTNTTGFKDYLVITCRDPIGYKQIMEVVVDKCKSEATFTDVKELIERMFNDERSSIKEGI